MVRDVDPHLGVDLGLVRRIDRGQGWTQRCRTETANSAVSAVTYSDFANARDLETVLEALAGAEDLCD